MEEHTRGNIIGSLDGNVLGEFDIIDSLEDCESLADGRNPNLLETLLVEQNEDFAGEVVL